MCSLAKLMSSKSVTDDDMDDCRSECSYYSLLELDETDPVRRIPASVVKQQAKAVPTNWRRVGSYPHTYNNSERLPLRVSGPCLEHPLLKDGPYISGSPGPARVVNSTTRLLMTTKQLISAQQVIASQRLILAKQISATQQYLNTLQSCQTMTSTPWIPAGVVH
ncbi:hypothetical protein NCS52_00943600 [Fusarium sp. LHS14.1]|nr:hypothetical protein NCS52_00943600 [Fusarium sp. LHS14.1]